MFLAAACRKRAHCPTQTDGQTHRQFHCRAQAMLDNFGGYVAAEPEAVYGYVETYFDFIAHIYYIPRIVIVVYLLLFI